MYMLNQDDILEESCVKLYL